MTSRLMLAGIVSGLIYSCSDSNRFYDAGDFYSVRKIDAHAHLRTYDDYFVEQAKINDFRLLCIIVDDKSTKKHIEEQFDYFMHQKKKYPADIEFITSFSMENFNDEAWLGETIEWIDYTVRKGAIAVKVWKNIGMVEKDKDGSFIMIDDPRFDPLFQMLAERGIPVAGHIGEPKNCWLPLDEMSTRNDRDYFEKNPEYHMYNFPEFPSYEEQIGSLERMLEKNPGLKYIGLHLASLEWDIDELASRLDRFPNMAVDLAERMGQIFLQTSRNRDKVRDFFIKYQDRILYGTDIIASDENPDKSALLDKWKDIWSVDWLFFVSDERLTSTFIDDEFTGLHLPKDVVDKIYYRNAVKWYSVSR
jgi:predicted TIM-barrel fold metal-dependent hydrolase